MDNLDSESIKLSTLGDMVKSWPKDYEDLIKEEQQNEELAKEVQGTPKINWGATEAWFI